MKSYKIVYTGIAIIVCTVAPSTVAYNICNNTKITIKVMVFESENKGRACLEAMGWQGSCWEFSTGQPKSSCKDFPPKSNVWLLPRSDLDVFRRPKQYLALHKIASQDVCDRYNARDIQRNTETTARNYERIENRKLYFMAFENFKKKSAQKIHFLASGYFPIESTISLSGSPDTGWKLAAKQ